MVNKQLLDYIKGVRKQGHDDETIKSHLKKHGYSDVMIYEAYQELLKEVETDLSFIQQLQKNRSLLYIIAVLIFVAFFGATFLFLRSTMAPTFCEDVSLTIYEADGDPVLCRYEDHSRIQMILENNGKKTVSSVDIVLQGDKETVDRLQNMNLNSEEVFTRIINYDAENGEVSAIALVPYVVLEEETMCDANKVTFSEIQIC